MGNTVDACNYHRRGCFYGECEDCHTAKASSANSNNKGDSACFYSTLEVAVHRLFLLHPLLDALGIPDEMIREHFLGTGGVNPRWCVAHLMDMTDSRRPIAEAVDSIAVRYMFRSYTFPDYDARVGALLGDEYASGYIEWVSNKDKEGRACEAPRCTCARTDNVLQWEDEFEMTHSSLAALLLSHQCEDNACDGCVALTTAVLAHTELQKVPKEICRMFTSKWFYVVPVLEYHVLAPYTIVRCRAQSLIATGQDLTPFVTSSPPPGTKCTWWYCVKKLTPPPEHLSSQARTVRELAALLGAVDIGAVVRTIVTRNHGDRRPNWPYASLFLACRSKICWPLLRNFVCAFLGACTRTELLAEWGISTECPVRIFFGVLFLDENGRHAEFVSELIKEAGCDLLLEEIMPILCEKLSPADCLMVMDYEFSVFRSVCARGSLRTVEYVYNYVKGEMSASGVSLSDPRASCDLYYSYDDFVDAAIQFNTVEVCAFLFSAARAEDFCAAEKMAKGEWDKSAVLRGDQAIIDIFKTPKMVKGAM